MMIQLNIYIILLLVIPLWLWARRRHFHKKEWTWYRELLIHVFFVYLCLVFYFTMQPFHFILPDRHAIYFDFNLFYQLRHMADGYLDYQLLYSMGNVLMFVPFGVLLPILFPFARGFFRMLLFGFLFSLTIELTQTFFTIARRGTIDDLFFNTVGAIIGFVLFWLFQKIGQRIEIWYG